jgi:hypothetical protein
MLNLGGHLSVAEKYVLSPFKRPIVPKDVAMTGNVYYFYLINILIF